MLNFLENFPTWYFQCRASVEQSYNILFVYCVIIFTTDSQKDDCNVSDKELPVGQSQSQGQSQGQPELGQQTSGVLDKATAAAARTGTRARTGA